MTVDVDVVVVGAGIHGCGVAQAVAAAGHSVVVLERSGIGAGTSSRSSKLIHGGLRYLETAQLRLVRESLRERRLMLELAPGLVRRLPMHIPVYRGMRRPPWMIRSGLSLYAMLARLERDALFRSLPRDAWPMLDGLATDGLRAVFRYTEAQTDDIALTKAVMASAESLGAVLHVPAEFVGAEVAGAGIDTTFRSDGQEHTLRARVLVNAAGPWAMAVARRVRPTMRVPDMDLVQGAHVEYDFPMQHGAYYVEAPTDGRAVFVLPHGDRTLVGTTETPFEGDPDRASPRDSERTYLHETLARHFPERAGLHPVASWAGLRVLPAGRGSANRRSRETVFVLDQSRNPRVLSIYGGKLTTWRVTAAEALDCIAPSLSAARVRADTAELVLG